ncbi:MAG: ArgE/DapE family deacylase [Hyphomicrobiales bacterium]|nr:ArgE/DapE family deacylase [Hyphomicrobiales bacterium]
MSTRASPSSRSQADIILEAVEAKRDEEIRFLAELVKVPSDNPPGDCQVHGERAAALLEALGFAVERHPVPADLVRANGMISATNLIIRHRFGAGGKVIALNAHGDVVPPGEGWSVDPYGAVVKDGVMYGRGVAVSKSDFVTYAFALMALRESGIALDGVVELHLTYDEEVGGAIGPGFILDRGLSHPDYVISAGFSYNVVVAHNGCLHLEVRVEGKSAHAARPDTGVDALEAATRLLTALYGLRERYKVTRSRVPGIEHPTLTVGLISGGINTNVVPDVVTMRIDRRMIPEENPESVERDLVAEIERVCAAIPGIRVKTKRILLARPFTPQPGQEVLVAALQRNAKRVMGIDIPAEGVPLYTDARLYSAAGIPTALYGAGPRTLLEANGHRADEKLVLEDLRKATGVVALTLAELMGGKLDRG